MRELFSQAVARARRGLSSLAARLRDARPHLPRTRARKVLLALGVLLVALCLALPSIVLSVVNDRLARMDGYVGRVDDVDVALWRGAYRLDRLVIRKVDGDVEVPFVQIVEDLFENHGTDRFATHVPVSGTFDGVDVDGWTAIIGVLSNTLIEAIRHGVEHEVGWRIERRPIRRGRSG